MQYASVFPKMNVDVQKRTYGRVRPSTLLLTPKTYCHVYFMDANVHFKKIAKIVNVLSSKSNMDVHFMDAVIESLAPK